MPRIGLVAIAHSDRGDCLATLPTDGTAAGVEGGIDVVEIFAKLSVVEAQEIVGTCRGVDFEDAGDGLATREGR